jgi:hypothetical protein
LQITGVTISETGPQTGGTTAGGETIATATEEMAANTAKENGIALPHLPVE